MSDLTTEFEQAQKDVNTLPKKPKNDDLLTLYSHFKQATVGDVSGSRPGMLDVAGRAKFDAWTKLKGTGKEAAMQGYVAKVKSLLKEAGM